METPLVGVDDVARMTWPSSHRSAAVGVVRIVLALVGVVGNLTVCAVILRSKSMHTVANCYLFNLSISDLIFVVQGTVFEATTLLPDTAVFVITVESAVEELILYSAVCVSVLTVTAFTVERYLAICRPFLARERAQTRRTVKLLALFWLTSLAFMVPRYIFLFVRGMDEGLRSSLSRINLYANDAAFYALYAVPMLVIATLYLLIGLELRRRGNSRDGVRANGKFDSAQRTNLRIIGVIVLVTFVCWTPKFATYVIFRNANAAFIDKLFFNSENFRFARDIAAVMFLVSPVLNPIIYSAMSTKFRRAFKEVIFGWHDKVDRVHVRTT